MNSKRAIFLLLAIIVAGATAFLARAWLQNERAALLAQAGERRGAAAMPTVQILVARTALRTGQIIKPDDMRWQSWPQIGMSPAYIIEGKRPMTDFVGSVARNAIAPGEPVTEGRLILPGTRGFMAAVLQPGTRAVSVPVTATSAVSGFIYAGDRVDVLLTHQLNYPEGGQHTATETILRNARVIAMDQKLDFAPGDKPDVAKTATLELTPKQSEIVTLAVKMGDLSLVLRSLQDIDEEGRDPAVAETLPAEPGDSYTHDTQVSRLIKPVPTPTEPTKGIVVLRGGTRAKQDLEGGGAGDTPPEPRPGDSKSPGRSPAFTRTFQSAMQ